MGNAHCEFYTILCAHTQKKSAIKTFGLKQVEPVKQVPFYHFR